MILQIDTNLLKKINNISLNQLLFLNLVLNYNQKNHQDVATIVSQVSNNEIQDLINNNYISYKEIDKGLPYEPTNTLLSLVNYNHEFDRFYNLYPTYVTRPDGTKGFLKGNKKKCEEQYKKIVKQIDSELLYNCLLKDVEQKTMTGKLGYMKTMWKWLTQCEWEVIEDQLITESETINTIAYGTKLL